MTPERLAEIEARAAAASPGPWVAYPEDTSCPGYDVMPGIISDRWTGLNHTTAPRDADLAFIAAARTDIPDLLVEIERLRAELASRGESR